MKLEGYDDIVKYMQYDKFKKEWFIKLFGFMPTEKQLRSLIKEKPQLMVLIRLMFDDRFFYNYNQKQDLK